MNVGSVRAFPTFYSAYGYQMLTVDTPSGFTIPTTGAIICRSVVFGVEGGTCRMRLDGTAASATVGLLLLSGDIVELDNVDDIKNASFYAVSGTPVLQIHYFGGGA